MHKNPDILPLTAFVSVSVVSVLMIILNYSSTINSQNTISFENSFRNILECRKTVDIRYADFICGKVPAIK